MNKESFIAQGWTPEMCRERMANCRKGLVEAKARGGSGLYSYRYLFTRQYLQNRSRLAILLS